MGKINYNLVHMIDIIDICNDISENLYNNYAKNVYSIYKSNRKIMQLLYERSHSLDKDKSSKILFQILDVVKDPHWQDARLLLALSFKVIRKILLINK